MSPPFASSIGSRPRPNANERNSCGLPFEKRFERLKKNAPGKLISRSLIRKPRPTIGQRRGNGNREAARGRCRSRRAIVAVGHAFGGQTFGTAKRQCATGGISVPILRRSSQMHRSATDPNRRSPTLTPHPQAPIPNPAMMPLRIVRADDANRPAVRHLNAT